LSFSVLAYLTGRRQSLTRREQWALLLLSASLGEKKVVAIGFSKIAAIIHEKLAGEKDWEIEDLRFLILG
jgi:hypothetical protein